MEHMYPIGVPEIKIVSEGGSVGKFVITQRIHYHEKDDDRIRYLYTDGHWYFDTPHGRQSNSTGHFDSREAAQTVLDAYQVKWPDAPQVQQIAQFRRMSAELKERQLNYLGSKLAQMGVHVLAKDSGER